MTLHTKTALRTCALTAALALAGCKGDQTREPPNAEHAGPVAGIGGGPRDPSVVDPTIADGGDPIGPEGSIFDDAGTFEDAAEAGASGFDGGDAGP